MSEPALPGRWWKAPVCWLRRRHEWGPAPYGGPADWCYTCRAVRSPDRRAWDVFRRMMRSPGREEPRTTRRASRDTPDDTSPTRPFERPFALEFREVLLLDALLVERLEMVGARVPAEEVSLAKVQLAPRSIEEFRAVRERFRAGWLHWDEDEYWPPGGGPATGPEK